MKVLRDHKEFKAEIKSRIREQSNVFLIGQSFPEGPCVQKCFDTAFESLASKLY